MEERVVYRSGMSEKMSKLLDGIEEGEIRRVRVSGLGLAFSGAREYGLLTISRPLRPAQSKLHSNEPTADEVKRMQRAFREAAAQHGRPVLLFKELSRETLQLGQGQHCAVRFAVYFGKQGRLL